ncbi:DGAT2-like protein [Leptotrombidium deliense]|uniref:diacylglycerol O-acyltransferase n=1 Tax=Leptotrombidium deliense TaxID=299467 RepID=A0A443S3P2_9ACAR|nr:DGAT2-like protein [Leptotrombidium deliense]
MNNLNKIFSANLVPCISFGENDVYSHIKFDENSLFRRVQKKFLKVFTFSTPIFYGRGFSESIVGYLPYRKSINTVVGKAISVEKIEEPTQEDIDKLHAIYVKALCDLFYAYREKFSENPKLEIVIK